VYELVPDDFAVPAGLEHERFRLRMLSVDDVVKDFDAICDRVEPSGSPEPPFVETVAENLVDLASETHDARVRMWVRRDAYADGLDPVVETTLREWLEPDWPFERVDWADRAG
jgi:hypothetical protein